MTSLTRMAAQVLALALLPGVVLGCSGAPDPAAGPAPSTTAVVDAGVPHFRGQLPVTLQVGRPVYSSDACTDDGDLVCDPGGDHAWLPVGAGRAARVVEARMDLVGGGTSWTVTVRFRREDQGSLHRIREQARRTGAAVVVLGPASAVLVAADVTQVEGRTIRSTGLRQAEAWRLVEVFLGGA